MRTASVPHRVSFCLSLSYTYLLYILLHEGVAAELAHWPINNNKSN